MLDDYQSDELEYLKDNLNLSKNINGKNKIFLSKLFICFSAFTFCNPPEKDSHEENNNISKNNKKNSKGFL